MKAQAAIEYALVAGFVLAILLPAALIFYNYSNTTGEDVREGQLFRLGNNIVDSAELLYYQGEPARTVLDETLPTGISNISIQKDISRNIYQLVFATNFKGRHSDSVFVSKVNIEGGNFMVFNAQGLQTGGYLNRSAFAAGNKKIVLEAKDASPPYVLITFK